MIKYAIIQASGKGTRMEHLTKNKPKALVSVLGLPMIFQTMKKMDGMNIIIIGNYRFGVLEKYLKKFAPGKYTLFQDTHSHSSQGIRKALELIPDNEPFLITWCDLYYGTDIIPEGVTTQGLNYIGLSKDFSCRWSFQNGKLREEKSNTHGVAGLFIFKNKDQIKDVPLSAELCRYLQKKNLSFEPFFLQNTTEVGTLDSYYKVMKNHANTRPFNSIVFKNGWAVKTPINEQGKSLAVSEIAWYKKIGKKKFSFIPQVKSYQPLILYSLS